MVFPQQLQFFFFLDLAELTGSCREQPVQVEPHDLHCTVDISTDKMSLLPWFGKMLQLFRKTVSGSI